jgi:uncharacterized protein
MLKRKLDTILKARLKASPAVALVGLRQSGKTTLARSLGGRYFDLEQDSDRLRLDLEWQSLHQSRELIILDEAQVWPEIYPRLRGAIDAERKRHGRFLLLGSVSPSLMTQVAESLAGRLSIVELPPLQMSELPTGASRERLWLCGGFPDGGVLDGKSFPRWQHDYLALLTQRDLPNWGLPASSQLTQRLLRMLAAHHGQEWNASQFGKSLGLSYHTVNSYLDYLEGAYLVRRLPAFHANIRKRLVKRPKVYWRDSGLLHALLNVTEPAQLLDQPWVGASWEGFVINQVIAALHYCDRAADAYYLRTSDQSEIDLIIETGKERWALEIKLTTNPSPADMRRLNDNADLIKADRRILVSRRKEFIDNGKQISCDLSGLIAFIEKTA